MALLLLGFSRNSETKVSTKYQFTDTVEINYNKIYRGNYKADFIDEHHVWDNRNPSHDGFQIFTDYKTTVYKKEDFLEMGYYYFPVYVANETTRTKLFIAKDSYAFGIQEAIDKFL